MKIFQYPFEEIAIGIQLKQKLNLNQEIDYNEFHWEVLKRPTIYEPFKSSLDMVNRKVFINKDVGK